MTPPSRIDFLALRAWPATIAILCWAYAIARPLPAMLGDLTNDPVLSPILFAVAGCASAAAVFSRVARIPALALVLAAAVGRAVAIAVYGIPGLPALHNAAAIIVWITIATGVLVVHLLTVPRAAT